jgi:phosphoribosylpyrophosphate synthetase
MSSVADMSPLAWGSTVHTDGIKRLRCGRACARRSACFSEIHINRESNDVHDGRVDGLVMLGMENAGVRVQADIQGTLEDSFPSSVGDARNRGHHRRYLAQWDSNHFFTEEWSEELVESGIARQRQNVTTEDVGGVSGKELILDIVDITRTIFEAAHNLMQWGSIA